VARFSDEELRRYGRQMVLAEIGGVGQERLRAARATAESELEALYLAAAGVGLLTVGSEMIAEAVRQLNPLVDVRVAAAPGSGADAEAAALRAVATIKQVLEL
jgi:molybdopterin/thiamine biosynthesis adenylyltransferase